MRFMITDRSASSSPRKVCFQTRAGAFGLSLTKRWRNSSGTASAEVLRTN